MIMKPVAAKKRIAQRKASPPSSRAHLFLSCEHAGNEIPPRYRKLFEKNPGVLKTHRGSDPGAFAIARQIERLTGTKLYFTKISRLVVDMNRSPDSETALSRWTKSLPKREQTRIFESYYVPYRKKIEAAVGKKLASGNVVHLGIHSFSPYLDPARKSCDIGILFDPESAFEVEIASALEQNLSNLFPHLGIRMNFPYRGDADGLTTDLRKLHQSQKKSRRPRYAGVEIEFNQALLKKIVSRGNLKTFASIFVAALDSSLIEL